VEAGGQVSSGYGRVGYDSSATGTATITGVGSEWTNRSSLEVGSYGSGVLRVEAGGQVSSPTGRLGVHAGSNGMATITGPGSSWTSSAELYIGDQGSGALRVEAGGQVSNGSGFLGYAGNDAMPAATATITGAGSKWTNKTALYVGGYGSGALTVEDGGLVTAKTLYASLEDLYGDGTISAMGAVLDEDLHFNAAQPSQAVFEFGTGGTLTVTAAGGNLGAGYKGLGSLTISEGVSVKSAGGYLGFTDNSTGMAAVSGAASQWNLDGPLYIGHSGNGTLRVDEGGVVNSQSSRIGYGPGASGTATISGAGSKWNHSSDLYVGGFGSGVLRIEEGGQVSSSDGWVGSTSTVTITGAGSQWTTRDILNVRGNGSIRVEAEGQLSTESGWLDRNVGPSEMVTVSGAGSKWINDSGIFVGVEGSGALRVEAGGLVDAGESIGSGSGLTLGHLVGGMGTATITGAGSTLTSNSGLRVGHSGSGVLRVEDGGHVVNSSAVMGVYAGATGTASVVGAGANWSNDYNLFVGQSGNGVLRAEAGGLVSSYVSYLGYYPGSSGTATITGAGSKWATGAMLQVGRLGSGSLTVEDGGLVTAGTLFASLDDLHGNGTIAAAGAVLDADLQFNAANQGAAVIGFGEGGTLTVTTGVGDLGAGYKRFGSLAIAQGAAISSSMGYLGYYAGSTGAATVTGNGSHWTNQATLYVGVEGNGALHVQEGGKVSSAQGSVGDKMGATGAVTVTGAGSMWTSSTLFVGSSGHGTLRVEAGGQVSSTTGYVGYDSGSTGAATITGVGTKWANSTKLVVGQFGAGALSITAGALVNVRGGLSIDDDGGGDSFVNLTSGGMLALWGNADDSLAQFLGLVAGTDAIRYWDASLTNWAPLTSATLGVDYSLQYQNAGDLIGYTLLTVSAPGPPGDFNFDGSVDGADFMEWQRGNSPLPNSAEDFATWQANFGLGASTPVTVAIPEPGTYALVALALASLLVGCRATRGYCGLVDPPIDGGRSPRPI
jgi:fibronectin-binding autotransporter adhesin